MELVSVIVPIYNTEKFLSKCLDSIINQTYKNIEIILVNDGSTDKSGSICEEYAKIDNRIRVIHKKNGGVSSARNAGLVDSSGEYICFVDSDDTVDETYVEALCEPINKSDFDIVLCNIRDLYPDNYVKEKRTIKGSLTGAFNIDYSKLIRLLRVPVCKLYNRRIIADNNLSFDTEISHGEDQLFNFNYYEFVNKYSYVDESLYNYNHVNSILSKLRDVKARKDKMIVLTREKEFLLSKNIECANYLFGKDVVTFLGDYIGSYGSFKEFCIKISELKKLIVGFAKGKKLKHRIILKCIEFEFKMILYIYYRF